MYTNMSDNLKNGDPSPSVLAMLEKEAKLVTVKKVILVLAIAVALIASYLQSELNFLVLLQRGDNMVEYVKSYFLPDFSKTKKS